VLELVDNVLLIADDLLQVGEGLLLVDEGLLLVDGGLHEALVLGLKLDDLVACLLHVVQCVDGVVDLGPQELSALSDA